MRRPGLAGRLVVLTVAALALAPAASAHVTRTVGPFSVTIGWGNEPPLAGVENFVEVGVTNASGAAVTDLGSAPEVAVSFGDARTVVPLVPTEAPGEFRAALLPTRPGTYTFDVSAAIEGRQVTTGATCSDRTFECVTASSEIEFPVKDPSIGEVAQRVAGALPQAQQASDDAKSARTIAIAALVLAALAATAVLANAIRGRRKSG